MFKTFELVSASERSRGEQFVSFLALSGRARQSQTLVFCTTAIPFHGIGYCTPYIASLFVSNRITVPQCLFNHTFILPRAFDKF